MTLQEGDRVKWIRHENYRAGGVVFVEDDHAWVAFGPVQARVPLDELRAPHLHED